MTCLISNLFNQISLGYRYNLQYVKEKKFKIGIQLLKTLQKEGFISFFTVYTKDPLFVLIFLKYLRGIPAAKIFCRLSKPGRRIFFSFPQLCKKLQLNYDIVFFLFSTQGLISSYEAIHFRIGGEVIGYII